MPGATLTSRSRPENGDQSPAFEIVVPTSGRAELQNLLDSLMRSRGPLPGRLAIVHDGGDGGEPLDLALDDRWAPLTTVIPTPPRGPAAARNRGWRGGSAPWIAFLDDDVAVSDSWLGDLVRDIAALRHGDAATQGRIDVPLDPARRPTDWQRNVASLERAPWVTADMAYSRAALEAAGGFCELFPAAFREDSDLALALLDAGWALRRGERRITHPVREAPWWISLAKQRGNADDATMRRLHGRGWRERCGAEPGMLGHHGAISALAAMALTAAAMRRPRPAAAVGAGWLALTARFALRRILPGPRDTGEVAAMAITSAMIPPLAVAHRGRGEWSARREGRRRADLPPPAAVIFDRDGTLIHDVPYNGDPDQVRPLESARAALDRLRDAGIPIAVVTNQSGVARGLIDEQMVAAVNARVDQLLGPIDSWQVCPHGEDERCDCRKPRPAMIEWAAAEIGVATSDCVVIGDIGSDVEAAHAAGARAVLVPTLRTRMREIAAAPLTAPTLAAAVDAILPEPGARP